MTSLDTCRHDIDYMHVDIHSRSHDFHSREKMFGEGGKEGKVASSSSINSRGSSYSSFKRGIPENHDNNAIDLDNCQSSRPQSDQPYSGIMLSERWLQEHDRSSGKMSWLSESFATVDSSSDGESEKRSPYTRGKYVTFGKVTIRKHEMVIGDNPSMTDAGPPLTLAWTHFDEQTLDLDQFEDLTERKFRQARISKLSRKFRENILSNCGFSDKDIQASAKAAAIANKQCAKTTRSVIMGKERSNQPHRFKEFIQAVEKPFHSRERKQYDKLLSQFSIQPII